MSTIAATAQTADRIDYWIRRHVIPRCYESIQRQSKFNPARDRRVLLSAIGQSLKDQYDYLAAPMPTHLAALVRQLETQERRYPLGIPLLMSNQTLGTNMQLGGPTHGVPKMIGGR
jgi:hypothetical protein